MHKNINLFMRVPALRLPSFLTDYLLYNVSVDNNQDRDEGNNDNSNDSDRSTNTRNVSSRKTRVLLVDSYPILRNGDRVEWNRDEIDYVGLENIV